MVAARGLLGAWLLKDGVGGPIVEAEAYHEREPACHAHRGPTRRNAAMYLPAGHLYVYRLHRSVCANVVTGPPGEGAAVLVRALWPAAGVEAIAGRRAGLPPRAWLDGPGKLCAGLAITLEDDGRDLLAPGADLRLELRGPPPPSARVLAGPRVGISRARELPWRFVVAAAGASRGRGAVSPRPDGTSPGRPGSRGRSARPRGS